MKRYTIVVDYQADTYLFQIKAKDELSALQSWGTNLDADCLAEFGSQGKEELLEEIRDDFNQPVPIEHLSKVWFSGLIIKEDLMCVNIVETIIN